MIVHMITELSDVSVKALSLPSEERALLARELIRSLDSEPEEGLEEAWGQELQQRAQSLENGETTERSAFEVLDEIRAKFS
jgi:putative addiction module component (TIGR02574 family)